MWSIFRHLFNHHTVCVIQDSQKRINWREAVHDWIAHPVPTGSSESDSATEQTVQQRLKGPVRVLVLPWQDIQDDNYHGGGRTYANQVVLCHPEDFVFIHLQQVEKRVHWFLQNVQVQTHCNHCRQQAKQQRPHVQAEPVKQPGVRWIRYPIERPHGVFKNFATEWRDSEHLKADRFDSRRRKPILWQQLNERNFESIYRKSKVAPKPHGRLENEQQGRQKVRAGLPGSLEGQSGPNRPISDQPERKAVAAKLAHNGQVVRFFLQVTHHNVATQTTVRQL